LFFDASMTKRKFSRKTRVSSLRPVGNALALTWERDFEFSPGQLVEISLREDGVSRPYSIFTGPSDEEAGILFTVVEEGELTPRLAALSLGDEFWIEGPSGSFPCLPGAGVWIANGTGVAPFLSMARAGLAREKLLVQGARTIADFYFGDELALLMGAGYLRCCTRTGPGSEGLAGLFSGRLTGFLESRDWDPGRPYELCGSAPMVVEVRDLLIRKGVPHGNIVSEVYY
jgi:ferredoxin/flavodoxin---NADP+ reductase